MSQTLEHPTSGRALKSSIFAGFTQRAVKSHAKQEPPFSPQINFPPTRSRTPSPQPTVKLFAGNRPSPMLTELYSALLREAALGPANFQWLPRERRDGELREIRTIDLAREAYVTGRSIPTVTVDLATMKLRDVMLDFDTMTVRELDEVDRAAERRGTTTSTEPVLSTFTTAFNCSRNPYGDRRRDAWAELSVSDLERGLESHPRMLTPRSYDGRMIYGDVTLHTSRAVSEYCGGRAMTIGFATGRRLQSGEVKGEPVRVRYDVGTSGFYADGREIVGAEFLVLLPACQAVAINPRFA
jgi:hypothetical protein